MTARPIEADFARARHVAATIRPISAHPVMPVTILRFTAPLRESKNSRRRVSSR